MADLLGGLATWGVNESVTVAAVFTLIEIVGLIIVVVVGADYLTEENQLAVVATQSFGAIPWLGVFSGAFLAFYAYLGFEDMVNVAEEVKDPQKNMPRAVLLAVAISTVLYSSVSIVAVMVVDPEQLTLSDAPLSDVYSTATGKVPVLISVIGIFAVINGTLIQMIMASRLLYGMASKGWLPRCLAVIHPKTRTPVYTTIIVMLIILFFALSLHLVALAQLTSFLVLIVFALVNLSLIKIKQKHPQADNVKVYSIWVPRFGFMTTVVFLLFEIITSL